MSEAKTVEQTREQRRVTLYRDDSTVQVVYDDVKSAFWTAGNTVLVIASWYGSDDLDAEDHYYVHWPRERFCWFKDEPVTVSVRVEIGP